MQRRTARFVLSRYRNTSSVNIMLDVSDWSTLQRRRQISRLSGLVHCPGLKSKLAPLPSRQRRGHNRQFKLIPARTQYRSTSFLPRTTKQSINILFYVCSHRGDIRQKQKAKTYNYYLYSFSHRTMNNRRVDRTLLKSKT